MKILKKAGKILLYIIAGLLILLFIAGLFLDPVAKNLLEKQVAKAGEGQYSLVLDDLDISLIQGDVQLNGVRFDTDSSHSEAPPIAFLTAAEISLEGVSWLTYLLDNKLLVDKIFLDDIDIRLFAKSLEENEQDSSSQQGAFQLEQLDIYPALKEQIDRIHLKDLSLLDISLTLVNRTTQDTLLFNAGELNYKSDNILIDADKLITDNRAFYSTAINLKTTDVEVERTGNKRMAGEAKLIQFVTEEEIMSFQTRAVRFLREPLEGDDTLLFVGLNNFEINKLDLHKVQEENTAELDQINLHQLELVNNMPPSTMANSQQDQSKNAQPTSLADFSLGGSLPELIERVKLRELAITNVFIRQGDSIRVENGNFSASNIFINEESAFADNRFLHAEDVESYIDLVTASVGTPTLQLMLSEFRMDFDDGIGQMRFEELQAEPTEKQEGQMWFTAEVGPFAVVNINTRNLLNRQLSIDSIGIHSPVMVINMVGAQENTQQASGSREGEGFTPPDLYPAIQPFLDRFYLRKLAVMEADIKLKKQRQPEEYVLHIPAAYLQLRDVLIAEGTAYEGSRILHTDDIAIRLEKIRYPMPDSIYSAELGLLRISTFEKFMEAKDFSLTHKNSGEEATENLETGLVYELQHNNLRIDGIQFSRMIEEEGIFIESVKSDGLEARLFQNGNYQEEKQDNTEKQAVMPQQMLKDLQMPIYIGSFDLSEGKVIYEQLTSGADTAGLLEVTDLFLNVRNVTNLQKRITQNPIVLMEGGGKLMDSGPFTTKLEFNMLSDSSLVKMSGDVDTLDMTELNRFTNYTTPVAFSDGQLYQMKWEIQADKEKAEGTLSMSYEDLTIQLSESKGSDTTGLFKDIGSFLINNLALETDVPAKNPKDPEEAEISQEREDKDFVSYYIASLVDGLKDIVITIF